MLLLRDAARTSERQTLPYSDHKCTGNRGEPTRAIQASKA